MSLAMSRPADARRARPVAVHANACPVEHWLEFLGHRWTAVILWHLGEGPLHHRDLASRLPGITAKVLAERLSALTARRLVTRIRQRGFPTRVSYSLAESGRCLLPILDQVAEWAQVKTSAEAVESLDLKSLRLTHSD